MPRQAKILSKAQAREQCMLGGEATKPESMFTVRPDTSDRVQGNSSSIDLVWIELVLSTSQLFLEEKKTAQFVLCKLIV